MKHRFFDLNVKFSKKVDELIKRAETLELGGVCLVVSSNSNLEKYFDKIKEIRENSKLEVATGLLIEEENINKIAKKFRREFDLILVKGGKYEVNRKACSSEYVDILATPGRGRKDCGIDHICCKDAKANNVVIELNFRELLKAQGMDKIHELNKMKEIIRLCKITHAMFIANSGAETKCELRGGRELASLSYSLGASLEEALVANTVQAANLIERNREKIKQPLRSVSLDDYGR